MTNAGEVTKKKTGSKTLAAGIVIAALGAFGVLMSVISGNMGAPLTWGMVAVGAVIVVIGYARRLLAAVESR